MGNRRIKLKARPRGTPQLSDFELEDAPIPTPGEGEVLLRTVYLSVDPYMRGRMNDRESYADPMALGDVMVGSVVAEVEASGGDFGQVHEYVSGKNQDKAWSTGDIDAGMVTVGMCGGLINDIPTCAELVDNIRLYAGHAIALAQKWDQRSDAPKRKGSEDEKADKRRR